MWSRIKYLFQFGHMTHKTVIIPAKDLAFSSTFTADDVVPPEGKVLDHGGGKGGERKLSSVELLVVPLTAMMELQAAVALAV
jgi:hypothetical protein